MNIKNISAIVASLVLISAANVALAEQPYPDDVKFVSTKTRAEVIAELQQARANGEVINYDGYPSTPVTAKSTLTRAQVIDELVQARARGELSLNNYEDPSITPVATNQPGKTRAQVMQELKDYQQAHAATGNTETSYLR